MSSLESSLRNIFHICNSNREIYAIEVAELRHCLQSVSTERRISSLRTVVDESGNTAVHIAASGGQLNMIRILLDDISVVQRLDLLKIQDKDGITVIHNAAYRGHADTIKCLLDGISVDLRLELLKIQAVNGYTAIHAAAYNDHTDTIKCLLDGISVGLRLELLKIQTVGGYTAIHAAAYNGHTDTIKCLLDDISVDLRLELLKIQDEEGGTAIHNAAYDGHTDTIRYMMDHLTLEQRLDLLNIFNNKMETALQIAINRNKDEVAEYLRQCKVSAEKSTYKDMDKEDSSSQPYPSNTNSSVIHPMSQQQVSGHQQEATLQSQRLPPYNYPVMPSTSFLPINPHFPFTATLPSHPRMTRYFTPTILTAPEQSPLVRHGTIESTVTSTTTQQPTHNDISSAESAFSAAFPQYDTTATFTELLLASAPPLAPPQLTELRPLPPPPLSSPHPSQPPLPRESFSSVAVKLLIKEESLSHSNKRTAPTGGLSLSSSKISRRQGSTRSEDVTSIEAKSLPDELKYESCVRNRTVIVKTKDRPLVFPFEDHMTVQEFICLLKDECDEDYACHILDQERIGYSKSVRLELLRAPFTVVVGNVETVVKEISRDKIRNTEETSLIGQQIAADGPSTSTDYPNKSVRSRFKFVHTPRLAIELMEYVHEQMSSGRVKSINDALKETGKCRKTIDRFRYIYYLSVVDKDKLIEIQARWISESQRGGICRLGELCELETDWKKVEEAASDNRLTIFGKKRK